MKQLCGVLIAAASLVFFSGCDGDEDGVLCITVTPEGVYTISGTAGSTAFTPDNRVYQVTNNCAGDIELSVEEDARWIDVDVDAFGGGSVENGTLEPGETIDVDAFPIYGSDHPERLDQLAPGTYTTELHFDDDTNDDRVVREVTVTVN